MTDKTKDSLGFLSVPSVLTPKNRFLITLHLSRSWSAEHSVDTERVVQAAENAHCCPLALFCHECCGTSGQIHPVKVSRAEGPPNHAVEDIEGGMNLYSFYARAVCSSSWRHMGVRQVRLCVEFKPWGTIYSNPVALHARLNPNNASSYRKRVQKKAQANNALQLAAANVNISMDHKLLPSGLLVVAWIVHISPAYTTAMGLANLAHGVRTCHLRGLVGHGVKRIWPDQSLQEYHGASRLAVVAFTWSSIEDACNSISLAKSYNQNKRRNLFDVDLVGSGLIRAIASITSW